MTTTVQTRPLISIRASATAQEAARLMADCRISAVGVLDEDDRFYGIVTERDLAWFVAQGKESATPVEKIAADFPALVEGPIDDDVALERMRSARVRHLIVRAGMDYHIASMHDYFPSTEGPASTPTVRDAMSAPAIACREDAYFEEIAELLAERDLSGLPVVDEQGVVVGVVSERDLAYVLGGPMVRLALRRHNGESLPVAADLPREARIARNIMTSPALTVPVDTPLDEVACLMRTHQVNRLPVVDHRQLVGVVTRGDVLDVIGHLDHQPVDVSDPPVLVGHPSAPSVSW